MTIQSFPDYRTLSREAANLIAAYIHKKPKSLVCIASGHTPVGVFQCLVDDVMHNQLSLERCTFVSLDEWVGIPPDNEGSCRNMMDRDLFHPLQIPSSQIVFFDSLTSNPQAECDRINDFIKQYGGLDIMLVGVGLNGHVAMNEPGTSPDLYAHVADLSEETKVVGQKYFTSSTPLSKGLTLGLRHFKEAKLPILMANGAKKAAIMQKVLTPPARVEIPASIVHDIASAVVMVDAEVRSSGVTGSGAL